MKIEQKKQLTTPIRIAIIILITGLLSKALQWWSFSDAIIFTGFGLIAGLYSYRFWKKTTKGSIAYIKLILVIFWCLNGIFTIMDFAFSEIFQIISLIAFVFWVVMEGTSYFSVEDNDINKNNFKYLLWNAIMILGAIAIVMGGLFSVLNWEYAIYILVLGVISIMAYILRDVFVQKQ